MMEGYRWLKVEKIKSEGQRARGVVDLTMEHERLTDRYRGFIEDRQVEDHRLMEGGRVQ